jgi:hypothetical protein
MMVRQRPPSGSTVLEVAPPRKISSAQSRRMLDVSSYRDGERLERRLIGVACDAHGKPVIIGLGSRLHAARYAPALLLEFATKIAYRRLCSGEADGPADSNTYRC